MPSVRIGRIGRAHGLRGEVSLDDCSLEPAELESMRTFTWRGRSGESRELELESVRPAGGRLLVGFKGIADRDRARALSLGELWADSERLPDPGPDQAYAYQLVGLEVVTEDGRRIGALKEILPTGAHPIYVVQGEREVLIPAQAEFVRRVDLAERKITVSLPPGLEEL